MDIASFFKLMDVILQFCNPTYGRRFYLLLQQYELGIYL